MPLNRFTAHSGGMQDCRQVANRLNSCLQFCALAYRYANAASTTDLCYLCNRRAKCSDASWRKGETSPAALRKPETCVCAGDAGAADGAKAARGLQERTLQAHAHACQCQFTSGATCRHGVRSIAAILLQNSQGRRLQSQQARVRAIPLAQRSCLKSAACWRFAHAVQ